MSDNDGSAAAKARRNLRQLRGRGGTADYLDVKHRLVWLREEHPNAAIETEHVEITADRAIFKATIKLPKDTSPGGGMATGYGSETKSDFGDFIEKAETKAIGRACAALGYGTAALEDDARIVDAPVETVDRATGEIVQRAPRSGVAPSQTSQPTPIRPNARPGPSQPQTAASPPPAGQEMSEKQRKFLFALAGELTGMKGEDLDVELHRMVKAKFGVEHLSHLAKRQVTPWIDELQAEVNAKRRAGQELPPPHQPAGRDPFARPGADEGPPLFDHVDGAAGSDRFTQ